MEQRSIQSSLVRRITVRYIVSLSLIALLLIGGQALIQYDLSAQASDAHVINIAGRQRMLSQRLAKAALAIRFAGDPGTREMRVDELRDVCNLWAQCQQGLRNGDPALGLPGNNSPHVCALYASIEPQHQIMVDAAHSLIQSVTQQERRNAPDPGWSPFVQRILEEETTYLPGMDAIVTSYDKESAARVARLRLTEFVLLGVTLCVLILEGIFIFRPAVIEIHAAIDELVGARMRFLARAPDDFDSDSEAPERPGNHDFASLEKRLADVNALLKG